MVAPPVFVLGDVRVMTMVWGVVLPLLVLIVVTCVMSLVVEGAAEAVLVEVWVLVVLAGRLDVVCCCDEVVGGADDVVGGFEDVVGGVEVEDCCVAEAEAELEVLMIAMEDNE